MNRSRRARSPPYRFDPRQGPEYEEAFNHRVGPFDHPQAPQQAPSVSSDQAFSAGSDGYQRHHTHNLAPYPSQRIPATYRTTMREPPTNYQAPAAFAGSPTYKILCITNINPKVSDIALKEALLSDFSRFGDISVSVCLDSGERLVYIYFRTYEEAREARRAKARSMLFDRPIEIEPIYENSSPSYSPPPPPPPQPQPSQQQQMYPQVPQNQVYMHRRSVTPPDYYPNSGSQTPGPPQHQTGRHAPAPIGPPHYQNMSPPNFIDSPRYPPTGSMPPHHIPPVGRYYHRQPPHHMQQPLSPYSSPPHDMYRSGFPTGSPVHHSSQVPNYHPSSHGYNPLAQARERDPHLARSPYFSEPPRGYDYPTPPQHPATMHPASYAPYSYPAPTLNAPHLNPQPHHHRQQMVSASRRSPPPVGTDHPGRYYSREFRREKLGENVTSDRDDSKPSRVIFVTNIDSSKTDDDLRDIFQDFGTIEDLELKRTGSEVSSALIKFSSMDCAYKAKTATNGKHIGSTKCRIFYGKVSASRRLWLGGLGPATTLDTLEDEFGKFGEIISLDYVSGRPYAYVEYETANQAQFATMHLKGNPVAGAERRIRIEYVDADKREKASKSDQNSEISMRNRTASDHWTNNSESDASPKLIGRKRSSSPSLANSKRINMSNSGAANFLNQTSKSDDSVSQYQSPEQDKSPFDKKERNNNRENNLCNDDSQSVNETNHHDQSLDRIETKLAQCQYIKDIVDSCEVSWQCQLVLRNFNFQSKMHMFNGRKDIVEQIFLKPNGKDTEHQCPVLKITQRWRLNPQPKLEEVRRRMQTANSGMFIITSRTDRSPSISSPSCKTPQSSSGQPSKQNGDKSETLVDDKSEASESSSTSQSRPIKNLISYLEQKDAAGVISLNLNDQDGSKLLYAFPPCEFALNLIRQTSPKLSDEALREEFLLGVIVSNSDSKA